MGIVNRSEDDVVVDSSLPSDALSSKQFATIVDVLSEGEIEGFPSAAGFTKGTANYNTCLLYTSPSPRDLSTSRMPSSA